MIQVYLFLRNMYINLRYRRLKVYTAEQIAQMEAEMLGRRSA